MTTQRQVVVHRRGRDVINDPEINKGTAFTTSERRTLALDGLLPTSIETIDEQLHRQRHKYDQLHDDLERHIYLRSLQDSNEVLFFRFLCAHLDELMPIVYTPTVGEACELFSQIYRRPHGVFIPYLERDRMHELFDAIEERVDVIVVTDGQRILGLGDQGVGGMGIPIGKLALYTGAGGIDPRRTLPVVLDVGTNNERLLADPLYLGWRHERVSGADYENFVDCFVSTVKSRFPGVLLQWEDFAGTNAAPLLDRYRHELLSFNDDIQGTAAVALGAIEAAAAATGSTLAEQRICIVGAGSAGIGIATMIRGTGADGPVGDPSDGSPASLSLVDANGLLHDRRDDLNDFQRPFARRWADVESWAVADGPTWLAEVVANIQPTVLVGVSGVGGLFTEAIVTTMADHCERPIIMAMSNPTSKAEAVPADLIRWTGGRAVIATGSPFDPVDYEGRTIQISQANNVYVFPGIGLGAIVSEATTITDAMFEAAARAVAETAGRGSGSDGATDLDQGLLRPIAQVAEVSRRVAASVAGAARDGGVGLDLDDIELLRRIDAYWWSPTYPELIAG